MREDFDHFLPGLKMAHYRSRRGIKRKRGFYGGALSTSRKRARTSKWSAVKKLKSIANSRTAGFLGIEKKFFETSRAASALVAAVDWAGAEQDPTTLNCLNCPTKGDGEQNRDGRYITMRSIHVRGAIDWAAQGGQTAADDYGPVQVSLVLDMQTNAGSLSSEDVYVNQSANAFTVCQPLRNLEFTSRFRVLKTVTVYPQMATQTGDTADVSGQVKCFKMDVDLRGLRCQFKANAGTIGDIVDNSLHIVANATSITAAPRLNYNARLRFMG